MKWIQLLMAVSAATASADITGTWKGTADTPGGPSERTFVFKVDGNKLTGETTSQLFGKSTVMDGKISGDSISFSINIKYEDNEMKMNYTGKVNGSEIKFHVVSDDGSYSLDYVAKKVSP